MEQLTNAGKVQVSKQESDYAQRLTQKTQELEQSIKDVITSSKHAITQTLEKHDRDMGEKISLVLDQLSEMIQVAVDEISGQAEAGEKEMDVAMTTSKERLASQMREWQDDSENCRLNFYNLLQAQAQKKQEEQANELAHKVDLVKDEIATIAKDAEVKLGNSQKRFVNSLKRLEKKYGATLESLLSKFEKSLAAENKLSQASVLMQTAPELRELLEARLNSRGKEIIKSMQRQVEQVESEYLRYSASSTERLEAIKSASVESLEKQLRIMTNELDRISRNFNGELAGLTNELPQIEEAGVAAAMAVTTYRAARLSFGNE